MEKDLEKYIDDIKKRTAFLGTPKGYDTVALFAFYGQIEAATRLSLYRVTKALQDFIDSNGAETDNYSDLKKEQYLNFLEDRDRVVIDLAIAGGWCGARYMGDAMGTYYRLYEEGIGSSETLEDNLIETLAYGRKKIADSEAASFGTDTHKYTNYMASLGRLLAIPGTENVVEHLSTPLDTNIYLNRFFKKYTVEFILAQIQAKAKKSAIFREQIIDWIKSHAREWNKEAYPVSQAHIQKITEVISMTIDSSEQVSRIQAFVAFAQSHLPNALENLSKTTDDKRDDWTKLIEEMIYGQGEKKWNRAEKAALYPLLSNQLGVALIQQLKTAIVDEAPLDTAALTAKLSELEKVKKIQAIAPLESDTIVRILEGKLDIKVALEGYQDQLRESDFFRLFNVDQMHETGIPLPLLEWLVVSHRILLPQFEARGFIKDIDLAPFHTIINENSSLEVQEQKAALALDKLNVKNPRHQFASTLTKREQYLISFFECTYATNSKELFQIFEDRRLFQKRSSYPAWKKVILIRLSNAIANITGSSLFKLVVSVAACYGAAKLSSTSYGRIVKATGYAMPILINNTPLQIIRAGNSLLDLNKYVFNNRIKVLVYTAIAQKIVTLLLPPIPYVTAAMKSISLFKLTEILIFTGVQSTSHFILITSYDSLLFVRSHCNMMSQIFRNFSDRSERERAALCKAEIRTMWNNVTTLPAA